MSIGSSGRIVIEIEPEIKRQLYSSLARDGITLKGWFLKNAQLYLEESDQLQLDLLNRNNKEKKRSSEETGETIKSDDQT